MRILVWFWSGGGGGSQYAARLAQRLSLQFGAENVAVSLRADDPTIATARGYGVNVKTADVISDRRRPWSSLASLSRSAAVLREHARDADVVIAAMNFAALAPLVLTLKQPLVYCAHDPAPHPGDYAATMQRATQGVILSRAAAVVALSHYAAGELEAHRLKLHVAPLASVFAPRPAPPRRSGPTQLLFTGRMIAYKGVELLAAALPLIAPRDDWRLVIAGHGPALTPDMMARFGQAQVESIRPGWMDEATIDGLYDRCDVVLTPHLEASQSGVVAEALAHGKPSVVTPVGALPEQIGAGRAGWLAPAATPAAFASAMAQALDPAAYAEKTLGAEALARELWEADHWSWLTRL